MQVVPLQTIVSETPAEIKARLEQEFVEAWRVKERLEAKAGRTGTFEVRREASRQVNRLIGMLVLKHGHSIESLSNLVKSLPHGDQHGN